MWTHWLTFNCWNQEWMNSTCTIRSVFGCTQHRPPSIKTSSILWQPNSYPPCATIELKSWMACFHPCPYRHFPLRTSSSRACDRPKPKYHGQVHRLHSLIDCRLKYMNGVICSGKITCCQHNGGATESRWKVPPLINWHHWFCFTTVVPQHHGSCIAYPSQLLRCLLCIAYLK